MTALSQMVTRIFLMSVASIVMVSQLIPPAAAQAQQKSGATRSNNPSRDLRKVGEAVAKAVLDKNIQALLTYDRADLRPADEESLKNTKSDLYCYIFDSDCITWGSGNWRSVYDKLSQAPTNSSARKSCSVPASRCARKLKMMISAPCCSGDRRAAARPRWLG